MPIIDITLLHSRVQLVCGDGEENHIRHLAQRIESRLERMGGASKAGELQLLAIAALLAEDACYQAEEKRQGEAEAAVENATNAVSQYLETLAERYENRYAKERERWLRREGIDAAIPETDT